MSAANLTVGQVVSFDVYPVGMMKASHSNYKVSAVVAFDVAVNFSDVVARHLNAYPSLPAGSPTEATGETFVIFKTPTGQLEVIGVSWIRNDTIVIHETSNVAVTVYDVPADRLETLRMALTSNGFTNFNIKQN